MLFFGLTFIACSKSGSQTSSESEINLTESQIQEQNYCLQASQNLYSIRSDVYENGSIYPTDTEWIRKKGFNLEFNEKNWFNLPDGDLKEVAQNLNFLRPVDPTFLVDAVKYTNTIKNICLSKYGIKIASNN